MLDEYPANGLALFNLACCEALLGRTEEALGHLRKALDAAPSLVDNARSDSDLDSIRADPQFSAVVR